MHVSHVSRNSVSQKQQVFYLQDEFPNSLFLCKFEPISNINIKEVERRSVFLSVIHSLQKRKKNPTNIVRIFERESD